MARDYTKYSVEGLGYNLNKRQLVFNVIKDYIEKNNPTLETLFTTFPDELQGSKGVIRKESEVDDTKRFNMKEPLKIKNGMHIVVSNQWGGDNIPSFIEVAQKLDYNISFQEDYNYADDSEDILTVKSNDSDIVKQDFYPNGNIERRVTHKDGIETWETYYENGQLEKRDNYKDDKDHGVNVGYQENGIIQYRNFFKNGEFDGVSEMYHENGQLAKKMPYSDGQENGIWEYYDANGHLEYTESYKNGKYHGVNEYYDENGNLRDKSVWEDGKRISSGL